MSDPKDMWQCSIASCGYIYNPDKGDKKGKIPQSVKFEDLPSEWHCPLCGAEKKLFKSMG